MEPADADTDADLGASRLLAEAPGALQASQVPVAVVTAVPLWEEMARPQAPHLAQDWWPPQTTTSPHQNVRQL